MPEAILKFSLPDEKEEFELANKAGSYASVLWDLDQSFLRPVTKYGVDPSLVKEMKDELHTDFPACPVPSDEQLTAMIDILYQKFRDKLYEVANDHDVTVI